MDTLLAEIIAFKGNCGKLPRRRERSYEKKDITAEGVRDFPEAASFKAALGIVINFG
jgi:hypothetical protein